MLNPMQKDALTEMVNVYVGQAASFLSEMVNQKVILAVPEVELITVNEAENANYNLPALPLAGHIISSSMRFGNDFKGKAFLVFPAEEAKLLVNACMGEYSDLEDQQDFCGLLDTDFDVLKEISNVILNAVMGEFGNFLDTRLEYSLPEIELLYLSESEQKSILEQDIYILLLHTSFLLSKTQIKGVIMIALSMNSVSWLIAKIDKLLEV